MRIDRQLPFIAQEFIDFTAMLQRLPRNHSNQRALNSLQLECLFSLGVRVIADISDAHKLQCSGINDQSSHLDFDKRSKSDAFQKTCYHSFLFGRFESLMSGLKSRNKILQILQNWS